MSCLRLLALLPMLLFASVANGAPRVDLEIALLPGFTPTDISAWHEMLTGAGVDNLRLGGGGNGAKKVGIEKPDGADGTGYRVFGVITPSNELLLPGGKFGRNDRAALAKWVTDLKASGPGKKPGAKPVPFGLQPAQLEAIAKDLGKPADFTTTGATVKQVLIEIGNRTTNPIVAEPAIAAGLGNAEKVPGELKGLACGTVAAAVLRREGLSFVPRVATGGTLEYFVTRAGAGQDVWPVGWPAEKPIPELLPDLFTLRNVEIDDIPASQLLQVVADRVKLPMLFDEQTLVEKKLDASKIKVKIPSGKLGYQGVLDRAMFQAGMKHEVRIDDAGRPFLWITAR
ncbi:MAG: hypothetical protein K8U03_05040 [Planctomycetia bacterium]|nr:hypothetical protein [Planctomycetia bacterium]